MRFIHVILALQLITPSLAGQNIDSSSLRFLQEVVNKYSKDDTIFYADGITKNVFDMFKDSLTRQYLRGVDIVSGKREIVRIQLSKEDKNELRSSIKKISNFIWPDGLFIKSLRIPKDSIFIYQRNQRKIAYAKYYDSSNHSKPTGSFSSFVMKFATIYQFMPPIYLNKGALAIFYYLRFCDGMCGDDELAVYKLENGKYKKWLLMYGGVF